MASARTLNATVKSISSGDTLLVVRQGQEQSLSLAFVVVPRFGSQKKGTEDEPFAFQARETLRKTILGKQIQFIVEHSVGDRDYCTVFATSPAKAKVNVATLLLNKGYAKLRIDKNAAGVDNERSGILSDLTSAEGKAIAAKVGMHGDDEEQGKRVVNYTLEEEPVAFLSKYKGKTLNGIVEQIRDGSTYRVLLLLPSQDDDKLPVHQYVNVLLSGVKAPTMRTNIPGQDDVIEPFATEAKAYVEARLLQREVKVTLEAVAQGNSNFAASVVHPVGGNIAEVLVKEGLAKTMGWSMASVTGGPANLQAAEREAKERRACLWEGYTAPPTGQLKGNADFTGTVTKIISGDLLAIRPANTREERKIALASIRQPKKENPREVSAHHEAKEALRKMLIGKTVSVHIDYVKAATDGFEERECGQVKAGEKVIAEILVKKGLAFVTRHRRNDDNRASNYDQLLLLEAEALEAGLGVHAREPPVYRAPNEVSESTNKAKQFLPFLQRSGRTSAIVEHVASGSRFRLIIPKESSRISLVLGGIRVPRAPRTNSTDQGEPFGAEALELASNLAYQREVEIEVEGVDKTGSFIGTLFVKGTNMAVTLLEHGMASVHAYSAENSAHVNDLLQAERAAKIFKKGIWKDYDAAAESQKQEAKAEEDEEYTPKKDIVRLCISEYISGSQFYVQLITPDTQQLSSLIKQLSLHNADEKASADFTVKNGAMCSAKFTEDNQWYRAKVRKIIPSSRTAEVLFTDYGNSETLPFSCIRALPPNFTQLPPQAHEATLTYLQIPDISASYGIEALDKFKELTMGKELTANIDRRLPVMHLTLFDPAYAKKAATSPIEYKIETSVNADMLLEGCAVVDKTWLRRGGSFIKKLVKCQDDAKMSRVCMWQYGDFRDDE